MNLLNYYELLLVLLIQTKIKSYQLKQNYNLLFLHYVVRLANNIECCFVLERGVQTNICKTLNI